MKKIKKVLHSLFIMMLLLCLLCSGSTLYTHATEQTATDQKIYSCATINDDFANDHVIIVFDNDSSLKFDKYTTADFAEVDCKAVTDLSQASGKKVQAELSSANSLYNRSTATNTLSESVKNYNQIVCLELAETGKDKVLEAIDILEQRDDILYVGPDYETSICSTVPNDTYYSQQWGLSTIQAPQAWDITTGSSTVTIGVLDTGIDGLHPDLVNRINTSLCRDFTSGSEVIVSPTDAHGHGTHVAGIIGAQGNNTTGISGVCWNVRTVSLKVFDNSGHGLTSMIIDAIDFAVSKDIPLLNLSGSTELSNFDLPLYNAIQNYSGLFICAAGNEGVNNDQNPTYPASYSLPNLITVAASNENNQRGIFGEDSSSNYGRTSVDLFAPGTNIMSTLIYQGQHVYAQLGGTSMATPFVTGVAALLLSKYPDLSPCEIKDTILSNVDDCGTTFDTLCVSGGRLNAYKALTNVIRHSFTYANKNSISHTVTCTECNYSFVRNHTYIYTNPSSNLYTHNTFCSKCSYSCVEGHTWVTYLSKYRCSKCLLVSTSIPVITGTLPPALLLSLQQSVGNTAIAIDENTFLCQVNGQYYLVKSTTAEQALQKVLLQS